MREMHWTQLAKDCYKRGCNCRDCELIPAKYLAICKVKQAVIELVRTKGLPNEERSNDVEF